MFIRPLLFLLLLVLPLSFPVFDHPTVVSLPVLGFLGLSFALCVDVLASLYPTRLSSAAKGMVKLLRGVF